MCAGRFNQALDIYVPPDFDEPDMFMDPLPQPYRRIVKVGASLIHTTAEFFTFLRASWHSLHPPPPWRC